jgi:hypothetical protein
VRVLIWGTGSGGAHRGELAAAKQVSGGGPATAGQRRGGGHRLGVRGAMVSSSGGRCGGGRARRWLEEAGAGEVLTAEEGSRHRLGRSTRRCGGLTCGPRRAQGRRVANGTSAEHSWHGGSQWWRLVRLEEWSGSKGAEASGKAEPRRAERKRWGTQPRRGSYAGIRTRHARGGCGSMGCAWSGCGGRPAAHARWRAVTKPLRHRRTRMGARWPEHGAIGRRGLLASGPCHFSDFSRFSIF